MNSTSRVWRAKIGTRVSHLMSHDALLSLGKESFKCDSRTPTLRAMALAKAQNLVSSDPVVVFSKSYCPYCKQVKQLLASLGVKKSKVIELDEESDGSEVQSALAEWTGQRTVPNVFIGGKHIGGCDNTMAKHKEGKLVPLLQEANAL